MSSPIVRVSNHNMVMSIILPSIAFLVLCGWVAGWGSPGLVKWKRAPNDNHGSYVRYIPSLGCVWYGCNTYAWIIVQAISADWFLFVVMVLKNIEGKRKWRYPK